MKIFITGVQGQLGQALLSVLQDHTCFGGDLPDVDIVNRPSTAAEIGRFAPDVVINCAAYTNVDGCVQNPQLAYQVNGMGAHNLALICAELDCDLVHLSTNEVYPGEKPQGYDEWDEIRPINPYGNSKAAAEFFVRHAHRRHYIVRTAWLYGVGGRNFLHAILRFAREKGSLRVVSDEVGNPTSVVDLAQAIGKLIATKQYGTYHLVNEGVASRWEFAQAILQFAGLEHIPNEPILAREFVRASTPPLQCALNNNAGRALGIQLRDWREALQEVVAELIA